MAHADYPTTLANTGIALPAVDGPGGYFEVKDEAERAWGDLLLSLFSHLGAVPMRRSFGSALHDLLFTPLASDAAVFQFAITQAAAKDVPHVTIINVEIADEDTKAVTLGVTFGLTTGGIQTKSVKLHKPQIGGA